jgi:hypothetical protein|tara:strand:- start:49 stop:921 length:873 start_codon:yes stop_codon:yes gene_type:complete
MKQKINIVLLAILISSCATPTYYQLVELSSENIQDGVSENQDIKVGVDFWANGGTSKYSIFNKSKKTIYIKNDECQVIKNGMAYDLYDNSEYSSTRGIITSKTNKRTQQKGASVSQSNIYGSSSYNTPLGAAASILSASLNASVSNSNSITSTMSNAKSVKSTDKKIYVLHPQSFRNIDGIYLRGSRFWDCDVLARVSNKKSNIDNGISYTKENTPLNLRIIITYSFDENFDDKKTYELDAYVNRFSNWSEKEFIKEEQYKKCEDDKYYQYRNITELYSPMRYYKRYNLK